MFYKRTIEACLRSISNTFPVLVLTGPRQSGKTTLLQAMSGPERKYVALDNPTDRILAKSEPELFLQRYPPPVIIDEVQYAPELFDYIKIHVDKYKNCGDYWLTGSQTFHLMKNVTESLAGRAGIARILGLSNTEIDSTGYGPFEVDPEAMIGRLRNAKQLSLLEFFGRIFNGSFPRLYENPDVDRKLFYESYLESYISRDVRDLTQVADELSFLRFMNVIAARTATIVNYETLAVETGISAPTAKQWLSVLVSSGLVVLIPPYANNVLKRTIKAPRMYFMDTGLCAYLTRMNSPEFLEGSSMDGVFFETWVVSEIYKSYLNSGERPPLYYYRDQNKKEIDLIIQRNCTVYPIEIKKSTAPKDAVRHFSVLNPITENPSDEDRFSGSAHLKTEIGTGAVVCLASNVLPIDKKSWYIPAWLI